MTTKTINVADSNLISGSSELIRQALGGYWEPSDTTLTAIETEQLSQQVITDFDSNYAGTKEPVDPTSLIDSVRFASRLYGTSDTSKIRSDEEWKAYVVGGTFGAASYPGVYNEAIYFDHKTQIELPLFNSELIGADGITGKAVAGFYKQYDRYQSNLTSVASEHLIPNFYFLIDDGIADLDIAKMITLDGTIGGDYFNYVGFTNELIMEQGELTDDVRRAGGSASRAGQSVLYTTEVSDPTSGSINTLFSSVASDKGVPRYSYNNIKDYLNVSYVNHAYQESTAQRLQTRLQNIMFLNPGTLTAHNDKKIATDFSFLKDDKKQAVYSLMPMANDISFDVDDSTIGLKQIIEANDYAPRFLKTLKEIFTNEIDLKPTPYSFTLEDTYNKDVAARQLNIVDLPEMLLYDYENLLSRTSNAFFYGSSSTEVKAAFDNTGVYRFVNSEIAINTLNDVVGMINTSFTSRPQTLESFLNDPVENNKGHEVLAYRVQKIGGPPTGDSRTENTLQNFWFFNQGSAIKYVDTQVKYGTDYTYKIFSYVAVQGYKYRLSDLAVTRQIAIDDEIYCLEFYDPATGQSTKALFDKSALLDVGFVLRDDLIDEVNELADQTEIQSIASTMNPRVSVPENYYRVKELYRENNASASVFLRAIREVYVGSNQDLPDAFSEMNVFATDEQTKGENPYLADLNINIEPSLKIVEVPIQEKTFKILDNPPNDLIATPHHLKDQSNRLSFFLSYDTFSPNQVPYPIALTPQDDQNKTNYLAANDLAEDDFIQSESVSMAETFEVYRLSRMPTSYQDFENNLRKSIDLRILKQGRIKLDAMFMERVRPNQKYYYTFRAINENGIAGEFTPIFEAELINDGGYVYGNFNQLTAEDLVTDNISEPLMSFKKLFNVAPNIQHLLLQSNDADFSDSAFSQVENFSLGAEDNEDKIWGKTFKLRLTSKKTGKKIDLNIKFDDSKG